jgi:hypothetical protein
MKIKILILFLIISAGIILPGAFLLKFTVRSSNGNVVLDWQCSSETNLKNYVVQRRTFNGGYSDIATVQPRSDMNYEYTDQTAYKNEDQVYYYQIEIIDNDGSVSKSQEIQVLHNNGISSVKRTWGSIKALFR